MSEQQIFQAPNLRLDHLAQAIGDWYRAQRFDVQVLPVPGEGMVVQAKQQEGWRNALGMSSRTLAEPPEDVARSAAFRSSQFVTDLTTASDWLAARGRNKSNWPPGLAIQVKCDLLL